MYGGFAVSGAIDILGYYMPLPEGTEQVGMLNCAADAASFAGVMNTSYKTSHCCQTRYSREWVTNQYIQHLLCGMAEWYTNMPCATLLLPSSVLAIIAQAFAQCRLVLH